jgi:hypothetical protein
MTDTVVIPGRLAGPSPESMNTGPSRSGTDRAILGGSRVHGFRVLRFAAPRNDESLKAVIATGGRDARGPE